VDDLARRGRAAAMIAAALRAEADEYVARYEEERGRGRRPARGPQPCAQERKVTIGSGTIPVARRGVNDTGSTRTARARSQLADPAAYARRSPKGRRVIPILYLRGLSTGDFPPASRACLGEDAAACGDVGQTGVCKEWEAHHDRFPTAAVRFSRYAYMFMAGIHVPVRIGADDRVSPAVVYRRPRGGTASKGAARRGGRVPRVGRFLGGPVSADSSARA